MKTLFLSLFNADDPSRGSTNESPNDRKGRDLVFDPQRKQSRTFSTSFMRSLRLIIFFLRNDVSRSNHPKNIEAATIGAHDFEF
jgi:hypothetical protein